MAISRTKEIQIQDLIKAGYPQRVIAMKADVCLATVNNRNKLFTLTNSTKLITAKRTSKYDPLEENARQSIRFYLAEEKRTHKLPLEFFHNKLCDDGVKISKSKTKEWLRLERNRLKESYLDIYHAPGEMVQFDWGTKKVMVNSEKKTVCFAVFAFPYSNYRYVYVTEKMDGRAFLEAFNSFTNHVGGTFPVLLIDNMSIAASFKNKLPQLTTLFQQLQSHYQIEIRLCTPYRPNQKGTVENAVRTLKNSLSKEEQNFSSLVELQEKIHKNFELLNQKKHYEKNDTIARLLLHENRGKKDVPKKPFIYFQEEQRIVRKSTLISFKGNYYSAPEEYKGERITVRYSDKIIYLLSTNGTVLAKYSRCYGKKQKKYRIWNILRKLQHKANGFDQSIEKRQMPKWMKMLYEKVFDSQPTDFFVFLEIIQHMKKDVIKRMLKWHKAFSIKLTNDSDFEFLSKG